MSLIANSAEGGTNGGAATAANSGGDSGTKFGTISSPAGGSVTYDTAGAAHGDLGYNFTSTGSGSGLAAWGVILNSPWSLATRFYINFATLPSSQIRLLDIRNSGASICRVMLSVANQLFIQNAAGTTLKTSPTAVSADTWYRIEVAMSVDAANAIIKYDYYLMDSTTPFETGYSTTTGNTGSLVVFTVTFGSAAVATNTGTFYMDDFAVNMGSTTYIGPVPIAQTAWIEA